MDLIKTDVNELTKRLASLPQVKEELTHYFSDGMYCREMRVPEDTLMIGRVHKKSAINILSKGVMLIKSNLEDEGTLITAPFTLVTPPGTQKMGYTLTECVFTNIFRTDKVTVEEAEEDCAFPVSEEIALLKQESERGLECQY